MHTDILKDLKLRQWLLYPLTSYLLLLLNKLIVLFFGLLRHSCIGGSEITAHFGKMCLTQIIARQEKIKIPNSSTVSLECVLLLYHHKVEKSQVES